jgi:hypothetical protein
MLTLLSFKAIASHGHRGFFTDLYTQPLLFMICHMKDMRPMHNVVVLTFCYVILIRDEVRRLSWCLFALAFAPTPES